MGFKKLSSSELRNKTRASLFERLAGHIAPQVESVPFVLNFDRLAAMPGAVQHIYWLWRFYCEASGNGMEKVLLDFEGERIPLVHAALQAVAAAELVRRFEAGIPHAADSCAEFRRLPDQRWFEQFQFNPEFPTLQSIDKGAYGHLYKDLRSRVERYIEENRDLFFE